MINTFPELKVQYISIMKNSKASGGLVQCIFSLLILSFRSASANSDQNFVNCLVHHIDNHSVISTPNTTSYSSILDSSIQNLRFTLPNTPKPSLIITPDSESQIQTAIYCSKNHGFQMRILSGGHDFEGSSCTADVPFFVLNMCNFRSVSVDPKSLTAWVGAGATLGEIYYHIIRLNKSLAFPGGYYPTVCAGGLISGGGYGPLLRKFGLAADNVVDARVIDAEGRILNRETMGEDLFWAIRGGVGASFAVILEYRIKLVEVSEKFTACTLKRSLEQGATKLVHKWQDIAHRLPEELLLDLQLTVVESNEMGKKTVQATFVVLFEGGANRLVGLMKQHFPELAVAETDCIQLRWFEFITYFLDMPVESTHEIFQSRAPPRPRTFFMSKADFVQQPIPEEGLEKIWDVLLEMASPPVQMNWTPYGAKMAAISETETPFPHRAGNIYMVFKKILWHEADPKVMQERFGSMRKLHRLMGEYVDDNPRGAYAAYRDLDLGVNNAKGRTSVEEARIWGAPYFKHNFDRLVKVKTMVDPHDYFRNEQSIPPLSFGCSNTDPHHFGTFEIYSEKDRPYTRRKTN